MKIRLAHKGLILVLLPLAFEIGLFVRMQALLHESDITAQRAMHSREIVGTINLVAADFLDIYKVFAHTPSLSNFAQGKIKDQIDRLHEDAEHLKQLIKGDAGQDWVKEMDAQISQLDKIYDEAWTLYSEHRLGEIFDRIPRYREFFSKSLIANGSTRLMSVTAQQKQIADEEPAKQAQLREQTRALLSAFLALGAVLSLALAAFFAQQISRRVRTITDNSKRVLENKPLNPPVRGTDEIHDLDLAFHHMSEQLRESKARDKAVQKLRDDMVAMISHDLRTPLETIAMYVELMGEEPDHEEAKAAHGIAERNIDRMRKLINDFLELERLQSGSMALNKKRFALSRAVEQARDTVTGIAAQRNIRIESKGDCFVTADEDRISQVITNLLGNAIKFSPDNSKIIVEISEDKGNARVAIIDFGKGIPAEAQKRIFEAFQQTSTEDATKRGGFGLGLAICKALVENHNGQISVQSQEGVGTTFSFTLPLSTQPVSATG